MSLVLGLASSQIKFKRERMCVCRKLMDLDLGQRVLACNEETGSMSGV